VVDASPPLLDFLNGVPQAEGRAVGTMVGHRIHDIGHRQDAGFKADLVTFELLRIA
jgi:hypothetical protein